MIQGIQKIAVTGLILLFQAVSAHAAPLCKPVLTNGETQSTITVKTSELGSLPCYSFTGRSGFTVIATTDKPAGLSLEVVRPNRFGSYVLAEQPDITEIRADMENMLYTVRLSGKPAAGSPRETELRFSVTRDYTVVYDAGSLYPNKEQHVTEGKVETLSPGGLFSSATMMVNGEQYRYGGDISIVFPGETLPYILKKDDNVRITTFENRIVRLETARTCGYSAPGGNGSPCRVRYGKYLADYLADRNKHNQDNKQ